MSRTSTNVFRTFRNTSRIMNTSNGIQNTTIRNISIGALHEGTGGSTRNYYSAKECALATIGDGLTDSDAANLYTIVQKYQTTLGRQV